MAGRRTTLSAPISARISARPHRFRAAIISEEPTRPSPPCSCARWTWGVANDVARRAHLPDLRPDLETFASRARRDGARRHLRPDPSRSSRLGWSRRHHLPARPEPLPLALRRRADRRGGTRADLDRAGRGRKAPDAGARFGGYEPGARSAGDVRRPTVRPGGPLRRKLGVHTVVRRLPLDLDGDQYHRLVPPAIRSLPVHPAQSDPVVDRRAPGADHHDEPEPPGSERPAARRA